MRLTALLLAALLFSQENKETKEPNTDDVDFICPMDKEVRSKQPGKCPRCGMKLVAGIPDANEFPVNLTVSPKPPKAGQPIELTFKIEDPHNGAPVKKFETMHEKLFHLFLVSDDLQYFAHEHPVFDPAGVFRFRTSLPKAGPYRVVADFYPTGGTPQLTATTMYVAGKREKSPPLPADLNPQTSENLKVSLTTEPQQPLAGFKTLLFFDLKQTEGNFALEQYLGAWGHMLAVSEDLIDLVHTHPFIAEGGPKVQFNMIFPREGIYRVWVQFQSKGKVNTVAFNIPVQQLK